MLIDESNYENHYHDHDETSSQYHHHYERYLAGEKDEVRIDYSVFSVGVWTLVLILGVEMARHCIDHHAQGKPFFRAVLDGVYAELSTLGFVEFFLYVFMEYYEDYDKAKKEVFADVHFALFYTAILNAIQTVILAFVTRRLSRQKWIQTESFNIDHYVEIREEFDSIRQKLLAMKKKTTTTTTNTKTTTASATVAQSTTSSAGTYPAITRRDRLQDLTSSSTKNSSESDSPPTDVTNVEEEAFREIDTMGGLCRTIYDLIRFPALKRRYYHLLVQVRFHELRVFFLQAYDLPLKLKISDYLMRSEQEVLIHLVHVSPVAWLLFTGGMNVLYYAMGVFVYGTERAGLTGKMLGVSFMYVMALFVVIAIIVYFKMNTIFHEIMLTKNLWDVRDDSEVGGARREILARRQRELFWFGDPSLVIAAIQFMQFGYAVALSSVIIYWNDISEGDIPVPVYLFAMLITYSIFVFITARVIPRYTLATSLGQLVNERLLQATLASFQLEEEKSRIQRMQQEQNNLVSVGGGALGGCRNVAIQQALSSPAPPKVPIIGDDHDDNATTVSEAGAAATLMAQFVKLETAALRTNLLQSQREQSSDEEAKQATRRTVSDGVAAMSAAMSATITNNNTATPNHSEAEQLLHGRSRDGGRSPQVRSVSDGVALMARSIIQGEVQQQQEQEMMQWQQEISTSASGQHNQKEAAVTNSSLGLINEQDESDSSDTEDVTKVDPALFTPQNRHHAGGGWHLKTHEHEVPLRTRLCEYFASKQYVVVSNVLGTMVIFFLVGQRVHGFNASQGIISDEFVSFHIRHETTFWLIVSWLVMFIIKSSIGLLCAVLPGGSVSDEAKTRVKISAAIDIILSGGCLAALLIGELRRCCQPYTEDDSFTDYSTDGGYRFLAGETDEDENEGTGGGYSHENESEDHEHAKEPPACGCPVFGSRMYGGYGNVEPYVALIAFRIFRHRIARRIIRCLRERANWMATKRSNNNNNSSSNADSIGQYGTDLSLHSEGKQVGSVDDHHNDHDGDHGHSHGHGDGGSIVELWETAIAQHPNIVEEFGPFSGQLLRAMLGVNDSLLASKTEGATLGVNEPSVASKTDGRRETGSVPVPVAPSHAAPIRNLQGNNTISKQPSLTKGSLGKLSPPPGHTIEPSGGMLVLQPSMKSRMITEDGSPSTRLAQYSEVDSIFQSPTARLVRSMRRCDRRLVPLLGRWSAVDVAITRFEIVYFDAVDVDGPAALVEAKSIREAISATKGGKGLRLCDVALGRRVVGRLSLLDIQCVNVEREVFSEEEEVNADRQDVPLTEYWTTKASHENLKVVELPRTQEWRLNKQDRLKIQTTNGLVLYLRFYSDLEKALSNSYRMETRDDGKGPLVKTNAFHWAQAIGRYCGPDQLRQSLPHFGEGTDDELRDYLVVRRREESLRSMSSRFSAASLSYYGKFRSISFGTLAEPESLPASQRWNGQQPKVHPPTIGITKDDFTSYVATCRTDDDGSVVQPV